MKLSEGVELICPHRAVYIKSLDTIAIADLHLGFEGIAAEQGVFIPKVQFKKEMEELKAILRKKKAETIIINGDVKHEFSETSYHEFVEVRRLYNFLIENFSRVVQIKGNHDNYIIYVTRKHGVELHDSLDLGGYYFAHGHREAALGEVEAESVVMAHEHPAIALYDEVGGKEKVKCFLHGEVEGKEVIVMPAFSYLAEGSEVNITPQSEFLSPLLRRVELSKFGVTAISREAGVLEFGNMEKLRRVS